MQRSHIGAPQQEASTGNTTTALAKALNPDQPKEVVNLPPVTKNENTSPVREHRPHRYMTPNRPNDSPPPPGYVRRYIGMSGDDHWDQPEEEYYTHLLLNYS